MELFFLFLCLVIIFAANLEWRRRKKFPSYVRYNGRMATFFLPADKLKNEKYAISGKLPYKIIEDYLMKNFGGFTHETKDIHGLWMPEQLTIIKDIHEKFEVSFKGKDKIIPFLSFLSDICKILQEESLYVTLGKHSYWVMPK